METEFFSGLRARIREGAQRSQRDYMTEVEASLDGAAIRTARGHLAQALATGDPDGVLEHVRDAQAALVSR